MLRFSLIEARNALSEGGIIAYPTETVFGLGCDPYSESALLKLMILKGRRHHSGFILLGASWDQLLHFVQQPKRERMQQVRAKAKQPVTWVFNGNPGLPSVMYGPGHSLAVRVTTHPIAAALCEQCGPIVSTSANFHAEAPRRRQLHVLRQFRGLVDYIVPGEPGPFAKPSQIRDARSGKIIRA